MSDPIEQGEVQLDVVSDKEIAYAARQDEPPQTYIREDVVRAQIEAAVKRALEGAAAYIAPHPDHDKSDWTDFAWEHDRLARRIRALDPAQFIDGDRDG